MLISAASMHTPNKSALYLTRMKNKYINKIVPEIEILRIAIVKDNFTRTIVNNSRISDRKQYDRRGLYNQDQRMKVPSILALQRTSMIDQEALEKNLQKLVPKMFFTMLKLPIKIVISIHPMEVG